METTPGLVHEQPVALPADTSAYLARIAQEQSKFLGALADASSMLTAESTQVSKMASIQSRLTREFFDAQRSIIRRRAETDVAVGRIALDADATASSMLTEARTRAAHLHGGRPLAVPRPGARPAALAPPAAGPVTALASPRATDGGGVAVAERAPASVRRQIADLGTAVVRDTNDAEDLAALIDEALEPAEPDDAIVRRQLREVLDEWWRHENQEGSAAIDDANARAAMRLHLARIEADGIVQRADVRSTRLAPDVYRYQPSPVLSSPMIDALDRTDHRHLDAVLASMLDALDPAVAGTEARTIDASLVTVRDEATVDGLQPPASVSAAVTDLPTPVLPPAPTPLVAPSEVLIRLPDRPVGGHGVASPQLDDGFWTPPAASRSWVFPHVLLPAIGVIGVLAFVLAIVG